MDWAEDEMLQGYIDGLDPYSPTPSGNRSACYRHGFANGVDDRMRRPRNLAAQLRIEADAAIAGDKN